jgi:hypothetical protein
VISRPRGSLQPNNDRTDLGCAAGALTVGTDTGAAVLAAETATDAAGREGLTARRDSSAAAASTGSGAGPAGTLRDAFPLSGAEGAGPGTGLGAGLVTALAVTLADGRATRARVPDSVGVLRVTPRRGVSERSAAAESVPPGDESADAGAEAARLMTTPAPRATARPPTRPTNPAAVICLIFATVICVNPLPGAIRVGSIARLPRLAPHA